MRYKALHQPLFTTYDLLRAVYEVTGDLARQVICVDQMIQSMESSGEMEYKDYFYMRAGETYANAGLYDRSLYYCRKVSLINKDEKKLTMYYDLFTMIVEDLLNKGSAREAYEFLIKMSGQYPPKDLVQKEYIAYYSGACNTALQKYDAAEKDFLLMLALTDSIRKDKQVIVMRQSVAPDRYLTMGNFYFITHAFTKAEFYRKKIVIHPGDVFTLDFRRRLEKFYAQLDSAQGRYSSALDHHERYVHFNDSLNNVAKMIQILELEIKYETVQKDKDIQSQAGNIRLLTRQAQLQKSEAVQSRTIRNLMIGGLFILLLLVGVVYNRYRLKQRNNRMLEQQKMEITHKNERLEKLLSENEWLLREVHHRVKNNLQVIMSLLNSQSSYLQDAAAISAVMDSRHRVQAMSLIHQKLYRSDTTSTIDMPEYIGDLLEYLAFSLKKEYAVVVKKDIANIALDVAQAIPVGLIINEVITNAYKHAFPHTEVDMISISLLPGEGGNLVLFIADNGKGLPTDLHIGSNNSFGMTLIYGLAEDLNGSLHVSGKGGTAYTISFSSFRAAGSPGPGSRS